MNPKLKTSLIIVGGIAACGILGVLGARVAVVAASPLPEDLGVVDGQLAPCPDTPNCVSSQADNPEQRIEPIPYTMPTDEARLRLMEIFEAMPRTQLAVVSNNYLHAESRSSFWGFIDDTEIYLDEEANLIHIRAAARLGREDFGVNRQRAEEIRRQFMAGS